MNREQLKLHEYMKLCTFDYYIHGELYICVCGKAAMKKKGKFEVVDAGYSLSTTRSRLKDYRRLPLDVYARFRHRYQHVWLEED